MSKRLRLGRLLRRANPIGALSSGLRWLSNQRKLRFGRMDYIWFPLPPNPPPLPEPRSWLQQRVRGRAPLSLWEIDKMLTRIADDPRPRGILLQMGEPALSLADLQTLRASILRFRARGKRVVVYAQSYSLAAYFLASACDEIVLQPGGDLNTLGLRQRAIFLKDTLESAGIALDVVAISPFKSAFDQLARATISDEGRAQIDWLLDSRYGMIVDAIAQGRSRDAEAIRAMIDRAPHLDDAALASGYVDALLHEHQLPAHLGCEHLVPLERARKLLIRKPRRADTARSIAILPVEGLMTPGESAKPPIDLPIPFIGGATAGDRTVVQQVRQLMKADSVAAVVLFIDSGGGSAIAAEAMTAALEQLALTKPLVVYMNGVAASGGYYIATAGQWIVAQPGTITGSIGVILGKPVTRGLYERFRVNTVDFQRGANADLFDDSMPFTDAQRGQMRASIEHIYGQFIARVGRARGLTTEAVDAVGGGRVWTGEQARGHRLVDELGDLHAALAKARALASLPAEAPVILWRGKGAPLPPAAARQAALGDALARARALLRGRALLLLDVWWTDGA
jgi:protease-4